MAEFAKLLGGKRVQTINPPGSEVGPGAIATWGKSTEDKVNALGFKWERNGKSNIFHLIGEVHRRLLIAKSDHK